MASDAIDRLQGLRSGVAVKTPARAVATSNITLSGEQTVDGVALVAGDRVLVTGQTSAVGNGVYDVALDAWTRSLDFDGVSDLTDGTMMLVLEGTSYGATMWRLDAAGTPDEDALTFSSGVWVADGSVGTAELAALCVTTAKLAAEAVTAAKLATDAVETAKIKDANVTAAKLAADAVTAVKLAADAVETAKIKDANVTAAKLASDLVNALTSGTPGSSDEFLFGVAGGGGVKKAAALTMKGYFSKAKAGTFAKPGGTGNSAVTGVGFAPKALFIFAAVPGGGARGSVGFGTDVSGRGAFYYDTGNVGLTASAILYAGSVADLTSLDSDGFTLNWSNVGTTITIAYLALGN